MDPVSPSDRLIMLLRQKLAERSRLSHASMRQGASAHPTPSRGAGVSSLARFGELDDRQLRRMIIQQILADQLEPALVNDARFQQIVSRVTDAIEDEEDTALLMSEVVAEVRRQ